MRVHIDFAAREQTATWPLREAGHTIAAEPSSADAVLTDRAHAGRIPGTRTYWRPRGNWWRVMDDKILGRIRAWWRSQTMLSNYDGIVAPGAGLYQTARKYTRQSTLAIVPLPVDPDEWPTVDHTDTELRLLTLTNFDYWPKVEPILTYASTIQAALDEYGGEWVVAGNGEHYDRVADELIPFSGIQTPGFVPAKPRCSQANIMLHLSGMDIQVPNAILEGLASNLPVVVNGFEGFDGVDPLVQCPTGRELFDTLGRLTAPRERRVVALQGQEYVRAKHTPERIGRQYGEVLAA